MLGYCKLCGKLVSIRPTTKFEGRALEYKPIVHDVPRMEDDKPVPRCDGHKYAI